MWGQSKNFKMQSKTTKTITTKTQPNRPKPRKLRRLRRITRRRRIPRRSRAMPLARPVNFRRTITNTNIANTTARVTGKDLVYKIPTTITNSAANVIAVIPSNPAYWLGTRVATIARGYQNYRPVRFHVHYVPQCAATQAGNVIAGTVYHEAPSVDNLQQSLKTSNGGMITQVFKPATSIVKVGTNLQKNLYRVGGDIDDDSMPFYFIAVAIACKDTNNNAVVPGYFYVDYTFIFKNPIGGSIDFGNSGLDTLTNAITKIKKGNIKAILCQEYNTVPVTLSIGTQLDIEYDYENQAWTFYYNGSQISTPNKYMWIFSNEQSNGVSNQQMKEMTKQPIQYDEEIEDHQQPFILQPYTALIEQIGDMIRTYTTQQLLKEVEMDPSPSAKYFVSYTDEQDFGKYDFLQDDIISFITNTATKYLIKNPSVRSKPEYHYSHSFEATLINLQQLTLDAHTTKQLDKNPKTMHLSPLDDEPK